MNDDFCVVFITTPSSEEGKKIAQGLLEEKLAACVNVVNKIESRYWWEGKIESAEEVLLIVKTRRGKLKRLESWVRAHHSYTVPEVIALPIMAGSESYLGWLAENLP